MARRIVAKFVLFNFGFRPFFLGAGLFSVISMAFWMLIYIFRFQFSMNTLSPVSWHAHEMIFGYGMAVISGFLLTAVRNWTDRPTLSGPLLLSLFFMWIAARFLAFTEDTFSLNIMAIIDCLFMALLILAISYPIIKAKLWIHFAVVSKVILLLASNILYYLGVLNIVPEGERWGLYSGFYIILSLIVLMGRRLVPFFIERGVDHLVQLHNWKWLDISSMVLFIIFCIVDVFFYEEILTAALSGLLFVLYSIRMIGWYTREVWKKPLLWVIYLAYGWIAIGFGLKVGQYLFNISPYLSIHAFAVGCVGMMTVGMMARVAIGHTGRDIREPPKALFWIFASLLLAALLRVAFPLFDPSNYVLWIGLSQLLWIISFSIFLTIYLPILVSPRYDGKPG